MYLTILYAHFKKKKTFKKDTQPIQFSNTNIKSLIRHQATIPVRQIYNKVAASGKGDSDRMHNFSHLVHHGNEPDHLCSEYKVKRAEDRCRMLIASNQSIHV